MSIKEQILRIATDPVKGRILSAQMLDANKRGIDPVVQVDNNKKIRLVRISEVKSPA